MRIDNKMTLKEVSRFWNSNYIATTRKLKRLIKGDPEIMKHIIRDGWMYLVDEYVAEKLKPSVRHHAKTRMLQLSDNLNSDKARLWIDSLNAEMNYYEEKKKEISEKIHKAEAELLHQRMKSICGVIYKILGREYFDGDENRLEAFLTDSEKFRIYMNINFDENKKEEIIADGERKTHH